MPFSRENFQTTFNKGDLLYGTNEACNEYIKNDAIFPLLTKEYKDMQGTWKFGLSQTPRLYQLVSSYAGNQDGYHKKQGEGTIYNVKKNSDGLQTRRKCKRGIFGHVSREQDDEHGMVAQLHFLLDGIDFERVQKKMKPAGKNYHVTDSELRWIFRWRQLTEVQNRIQFWMDHKPCVPPWGEDQSIAAWGYYRPKRSAKCYRTLFDLIASKINVEEKMDPSALSKFFSNIED